MFLYFLFTTYCYTGLISKTINPLKSALPVIFAILDKFLISPAADKNNNKQDREVLQQNTKKHEAARKVFTQYSLEKKTS